MGYRTWSNNCWTLDSIMINKEQLHKKLTSGRLSKPHVLQLVEELYQAPQLVGELLKAVWVEDKENTFNASWVFDHLMRKKLPFILPFIEDFANGLGNLESESCIRPMAHTCELLVLAKYKNKDPKYITGLTRDITEKIVAANFDWLLGSKKVAAKVFAMTSLLYLGTEYTWIHSELKPFLENSINSGTVGYKTRARKTLDKLIDLGV